MNTVSTASRTSSIDLGLRAYMVSVYNNMGIGMLISGAVAWLVGTNAAIAQLVFGGPQAYLFAFAPLIAVLALSFGIERLSPPVARLAFWAFSGLMGISLGSVFLNFQLGSIFQIFVVTAALFFSMSLYGYTTKRDLTSIGSFLIMGAWGIILTAIVNIFLQSTMLQFAISAVAAVIFTGLTAYDTQRIKELYDATDGNRRERAGIMGALTLYLDFVNIFISLLQLFGGRK